MQVWAVQKDRITFTLSCSSFPHGIVVFFFRLNICMQKLHEYSAHEVRLLKVSEELILVISYLSCSLPLEVFFSFKCSHVLGCFRARYQRHALDRDSPHTVDTHCLIIPL